MSVELKTLTAVAPRVSMLLWGPSGCGKTHFANTAPGPKLILNFDPDGTNSLPRDEHTHVLDYSDQLDATAIEAKSQTNPFNLDTILLTHKDIETVIVDSVTAFGTMAVQYGVAKAPGATFENPGPGAYGLRNRLVLGLAKNILYVTARHKKNVIFICHEDVPVTDKDGNAISITLLLGGSLKEEVPLQISEVWNMRDTSTERLCVVRTVGIRKPMKTRMFDTTNGFEFAVSDKKDQNKVLLSNLFTAWKANNFNKIALPK